MFCWNDCGYEVSGHDFGTKKLVLDVFSFLKLVLRDRRIFLNEKCVCIVFLCVRVGIVNYAKKKHKSYLDDKKNRQVLHN